MKNRYSEAYQNVINVEDLQQKRPPKYPPPVKRRLITPPSIDRFMVSEKLKHLRPAIFLPAPINSWEKQESFEQFLVSNKIQTPENIEIYNRGFELFILGFERDAKSICRCGNSRIARGRYIRTSYCNHRLCPVCSKRKWEEYTSKIIHVVKNMEYPHIYIFAIRSENLRTLEKTVKRLRASLKRIRRLKYFRENVKSCAGAVEVALKDNELGWYVHCHLVLDVNDLDLKYVKAKWKKYAKEGAEFKPQKNCDVNMFYLRQLAKYISKPNTRCPTPITYSLEQLRELYYGFKGKRVPVIWGEARN